MSGLLPLPRKVRDWLGRHGVGPGGMVVAVSGGPDSVALLRALAALRGEGGPWPLLVAHLNHQLRGAESDADEAFVCRLREKLAAEHGAMGLCCDRMDVAGQARKERRNLEAVARGVRYDWLGRVAREAGAAWVATGHTADDQAETVLHRLLRGTGLRGLRGIAPCRELAPGVTLVRPLLSATRAEVMDYLRAAGQDYRTDRSNADPAFLRNRIRQELLPLLAQHYNPAVAQSLCRLAAQAEEACRDQEERSRALLAAAELPRAGGLLILDPAVLSAAPRHLVRDVFRLAWGREGWPLGEMGFDAWDRVAAVALGEIGGVDLPGGIRVRRSGRVVQVGPPA
ncbi:MAG TPA: tRNA lysidine(34) synthetase TilS [Gemmataceae bacterium]|nr:tRNA lysidine(34) synthetase TilS [Gemmataceae bacterium]